VFSWIWDSDGLAVVEGESLIEVWAVRKASEIASDVLLFLLCELVIAGAVVINLWVWDSFGLAIDESESLIEVWAVFEASMWCSPVWILLLGELVIAGAVVSNLWVWHTHSLSVCKGESLIEVWAMREAAMWWSPVWIILLLGELIIAGAVVINLWVWDSFGLAIDESESLIKVWAVFEASMWCSPVWILLLGKLVIAGAVVSNLWVWHTSGLTVSESESLIEVWAVREASMWWSPVWLLLNELILFGAVVINFRVWDSSGLAIGEGESLIEVWAVFQASMWCSPVWILLLGKLVIAGAVVSNLWVWHTSGLSVSEGESLIEVWAMRKGGMWWSPVWILLLFLFSELVFAGAVVSNLWVRYTSCLSVSEGESLIEVWAVRKGGMCWSPVWILLVFLLGKLVIAGAIISNLWVWHTSCLSVSKSESLIEVRAVRKASMWWSPVWIILLLGELVIGFAVVSNSWVCHTSCLAIIEGHSLIEIWTVWKTINWWSPVWWIFTTELNQRSLFIKLIIWIAVEANLWVWDTLSSSILKSKSFIEVGAVLQGLNITGEWFGSWVLLNEGGVWILHELDEGCILLHSAGGTDIWVLGNVGLAIVHDGSGIVRRALRECLLVPWSLGGVPGPWSGVPLLAPQLNGLRGRNKTGYCERNFHFIDVNYNKRSRTFVFKN
jgi:hypothetical protein